MARLVCKKCQHDNLIDAPVRPGNQPLQDWFCKKCDEKLFSVSFKKPVHADTVPITCGHCRQSTKLIFSSSDSPKTSVSWKCKCSTVLVHLKVDHEKQDKALRPVVQGPLPIGLRETARSSNEIDSSEKFATFLNKNWKLIGLVAIVALVWISFSDFTPSSYSKNSSPSVSTPKTQNVYRGTQIAKSEFYKYSKSQRRRIQLFLKSNFGYKSTIDGLWGPQTASSFLTAANRYARGKSLSSVKNVGIVFSAAIKESPSSTSQTTSRSQGSKPKWDTRPTNGNANLNLTELERRMLNVAIGSCVGRGPNCASEAMQNFYCMKQYGRPCQQKAQTCVIRKNDFLLGDQIVCY